MDLSEKIIRHETDKVFETMLFIFSEPMDQIPNHNGAIIQARIDYAGEINGTVLMRLPAKSSQELTRWILGEDNNYKSPIEEQFDMVSEVTNIVAGNILAAISTSQIEFKLDQAIVGELEYINSPTLTAGIVKHVLFKFDRGWAEVVVQTLD